MATTVKKSAQKKATRKASNTSSARNQARSVAQPESALAELFLDEIKDIYWAEKKLTKTLPKLQKAATSEQLRAAFATHLEQTKEHVTRLEQVFEILGKKAQAKKCDAMEGLSMEGESIIEDTDAGTATRDVGLIIAAQKTEHYEIATYGSLTTLAGVLGHNDIADILATTLQEEKETDEILTSIAENDINYEAEEETEEEEA
ncbi:ferritin-like domain-containing protein [Danxiaibacter flavus]|uniref:Ferritin-like domain-containing protein n=1 Tax=Danxiaibacter flavus TaxID=3049108 RepID=A0ABV3ZK16_9BACT|nr:ferritin-like domain-containing protein [Chitinophagaceae bacterium DXS]